MKLQEECQSLQKLTSKLHITHIASQTGISSNTLLASGSSLCWDSDTSERTFQFHVRHYLIVSISTKINLWYKRNMINQLSTEPWNRVVSFPRLNLNSIYLYLFFPFFEQRTTRNQVIYFHFIALSRCKFNKQPF